MARIVKPSYYDSFSCAAGACRFTCCQDWSIFVDEKTEQKWETMKDPAGMEKALSTMQKHVRSGPGGRQIRLQKDGRCPFLNKEGLCRIVLQYGEESISKTCHTYPREVHEYKEMVEYTLGMGCPRALELLWQEKEFRTVEESVTRTSDTECVSEDDLPESDADLFLFREKAENLLSDRSLPLHHALKMLFYIALDLYGKEEVDENYVAGLFDKTVLRELSDAIETFPVDVIEHFTERNELFLDLAENYRKGNIYGSVLNELAEKAEGYEGPDLEEIIQERISAYREVEQELDGKLRLLLQEEIYSGLVLPEEDLYAIVLKLQWIGIVFAVLRQCLFLKWDICGVITDGSLADITTVIMRMTGYAENDIEEYLEKSFEDIIWGWGYMALISG